MNKTYKKIIFVLYDFVCDSSQNKFMFHYFMSHLLKCPISASLQILLLSKGWFIHHHLACQCNLQFTKIPKHTYFITISDNHNTISNNKRIFRTSKIDLKTYFHTVLNDI